MGVNPNPTIAAPGDVDSPARSIYQCASGSENCRTDIGTEDAVTKRVEQVSTHVDSRLLTAGKRIFWAVMLFAHLGGIRSAWVSLFDSAASPDWAMGGLRLVVLAASAVFFALKIADLPVLRLKPGWRPFVASCVVVALMHVNVIEHAANGDSPYSPAPMAAMALVGALVESSTLRRAVLRLSTQLLSEDPRVRRIATPSVFAARHADESRAPYQLMLISGLLLPRPPPAV